MGNKISISVAIAFFLAFTFQAGAADPAKPASPQGRGARAWAGTKNTSGVGPEQYFNRTENPPLVYSAGQVMDVMQIAPIGSVAVNQLTIAASTANLPPGTAPTYLEIYYMNNQIYPNGPVTPLPSSVTTYVIPVYENVTGPNILQIRFTGGFTLNSVSLSYQAVNPTPPPPPPLTAYPCQLVGYGLYSGTAFDYRVTVNGNPVAGSDDFNDFNQQVHNLVSTGVCYLPGGLTAPACSLAGAGSYRGYPWKYLLNLGSGVFDAVNDFPTLSSHLTTLKSQGLCQVSNATQCRILGQGTFNNGQYSHPIAIGNVVVDGFNDLDSAEAELLSLRNLGLCN